MGGGGGGGTQAANELGKLPLTLCCSASGGVTHVSVPNAKPKFFEGEDQMFAQ